MIPYLFAVSILAQQPELSPHDGGTIVCGRTMRVEDQYCAAVMSGRAWTHSEAAKAYERFARFALPQRVAATYLAAANNWIMAGEPEKAIVDFDRALANELSPEERANVLSARARALKATPRR